MKRLRALLRFRRGARAGLWLLVVLCFGGFGAGTTVRDPKSGTRYEIVEVLGVGGFATVVKAKVLDGSDTPRFIALKFYFDADTAAIARRYGWIDRRLPEADARKFLRFAPPQKFVVETGAAAGEIFALPSELAFGSLKQHGISFSVGLFLPKGPEQTERQMKRLSLIATQGVEALEVLARQGVVHGDLKPDNFLLSGTVESFDEGKGRLLVADLDTMTTPGARLMTSTIGYFPPELITGSARRAALSTDLFSFSCVLYELTFGQPPLIDFLMVRDGITDGPARGRYEAELEKLSKSPAEYEKFLAFVGQRFAKMKERADLTNGAREQLSLVEDVVTAGLQRDPENRSKDLAKRRPGLPLAKALTSWSPLGLTCNWLMGAVGL